MLTGVVAYINREAKPLNGERGPLTCAILLYLTYTSSVGKISGEGVLSMCA